MSQSRIALKGPVVVPLFSLSVPSLLPLIGAKGVVCAEELLAWSKVLSLGVDALVVVDVILEAVLRLPVVSIGILVNCIDLHRPAP